MQRKTYAKINGDILTNNIKEIKEKYPDYEYYFGIVKNNAYHHGIKCVLDLIKGGINYLAVSSLEEALEIRKYANDIPILCLEPIHLDYIMDAINNNVTLTIESLEYTEKLLEMDLYDTLKIHLKIDSGMHRLGFFDKEELKKAYLLLKENKHILVEGVYSHFATSGVMDPYFDKQVNKFLELTENIPLKDIPIVHMGRSLILVNHPKLTFCNGIRLGIIMYGFSQSRKEGKSLQSKIRKLKRTWLQKKYKCSKTFLENDLKLKTAMELYTEILSVRPVKKDEVVGYSTYKIKEDGYLLTLPVGYADGVNKNFKYVYINGEYLKIIDDCMDMLLVFSPHKMNIGTEVEIFGKHIPISSVCKLLGINGYHLFNQISFRVVRVHVQNNEQEEISY